MKNIVLTFSIIFLFAFSISFVYAQQNDTEIVDVEELFNKGNELTSLGKYQEAIQWYDKAMKIEPNNEIVLVDTGSSLSLLDKHQDAVELYDKRQ